MLELESACKELIEKINSGEVSTQKQLELEKVTVARKYSLNRIIKNADITLYAENYPQSTAIRKFLKTRCHIICCFSYVKWSDSM